MKTLIYILLAIALCACEKETTPPSPPPPRVGVPYDRMISGSTCQSGTNYDVYVMASHNDLPRLAPAGEEIILHLYGMPDNVNGDMVWSEACFRLYVNGDLHATFVATEPQEFRFVVP